MRNFYLLNKNTNRTKKHEEKLKTVQKFLVFDNKHDQTKQLNKKGGPKKTLTCTNKFKEKTRPLKNLITLLFYEKLKKRFSI